MAVDLISVYHRDSAYKDWHRLCAQIRTHEHGDPPFRLLGVDNRKKNRGFAPACNIGAAVGTSEVIGFLNPDAVVRGPFLRKVVDMLAEPDVVITGCRFGKSERELKIWGCKDWVCGAAFFVRRDFWDEVGGFDEQFVWGWEETDLIRRAQVEGKRVVSIDLPIDHESPSENPHADVKYKHRWFNEGARRFDLKWRKVRV